MCWSGRAGLIWLIDFARTREAHPLFDFAHLKRRSSPRLFAQRSPSPADYLALLQAAFRSLLKKCIPLPGAACSTQTSQANMNLALTLTCLGALKYNNLSAYETIFAVSNGGVYGCKISNIFVLHSLTSLTGH